MKLTGQEVRPLFVCLEANDHRVRVAALECLIRLPLEDEAWVEVGRVFNRILNLQAVDARLFPSLAHVPLVSVRTWLRDLVANEEHPLRSTAAHALAGVGDATGAGVLAQELGADEEQIRERAARAIARCGVGDFASKAWETVRRDPLADVPFFVAVGAARSGELEPLREVLSRMTMAEGGFRLRFLDGDPDLAQAELRAFRPLPPDAFSVVREALKDGAPPELEALLPGKRRSSSDDGERGPSGTAPGESHGPSSPERRAAAEGRVAELLRPEALESIRDFDSRGELEDVLRREFPDIGTEVAARLVVELLNAADPFDPTLGNLLVQLVANRSDFRPDVPGLFTAYTRLVELEAPSLDRQTAWIASRAGAVAVIGVLAENLERGPSAARVLAAGFVCEVARYAGLAEGPMFGGDEAPTGPDARDLIDDVDHAEAMIVLHREREGSDLGVAREGGRPRSAGAEPEGTASSAPPASPMPEGPDFLEHAEEARRSGGLVANRFEDMLTGSDTSGGLSPEAGAEIDAGRPDEEEENVYALLDCEEVVPAGVELELAVGLAPRPSEGVLGGPLTALRTRRNYFLTVQVVADGFSLRDGESWRQTLAVTDDQRFPRMTLHLVPDPLDPGHALDARGIQATFTVDGEVAGVAFRAVTVVPDSAISAPTRADQPRGLDLTIPRSPVPPDLTVILFRARDRHELRLTMETPHEGVPLPEEDLPVPIGDEPRAFADGLVRVMSALEGKKRMYRTLRGRGALLALKLPDAFWNALRAVHTRLHGPPTLLLVSEDPYVPWELTEVDPPLDPDAAPFLSAQTVMGRWVLRDALLPPPHELLVGSMAAVAGDYADLPRWENLEAAFDERESLGREWGAEPVDGTFDAMIRLLERERSPSIVHVALHGKHSPDSVEEGLVLVDGEWLSPDVVLGTKLRGHPFVFLNACQVGAGSEVLSQYAGMAAAFLMRGASAVVAPLWNVKDEVARTVALSFYRRALGLGQGAGEAMRAERAAFREVAGDPDAPGVSSTLMAYQFFGHPALRLRREPPVGASPHGT